MLGRDKITVGFRRDGEDVELEVFGRAVVDAVDGKLAPFAPSMFENKPSNFYRLFLPRTLDLSGATDIRVSFDGRPSLRIEVPIVPVYDGHGRIHHYEVVMRT